MRPTTVASHIARRARLLPILKSLSPAALRRRGTWVSAGLALAAVFFLAGFVSSSPITIIERGKARWLAWTNCATARICPWPSWCRSRPATPRSRWPGGAAARSHHGPALCPRPRGRRQANRLGRAALVARPVRVQGEHACIRAARPERRRAADGRRARRRHERLGYGGPDAGPDPAGDLCRAQHAHRRDADDQLLNRVCVEVNEPLVRIELACNGSWLGPVPAGQPERITLKKRHAVFCLNSQPVPSGCTRLTAQVTNQSGNVSAPYDFGDLVCSIPTKQLSKGGARNALVVDADDRLHAAYILDNGVYYTTQAPDGAWLSEPIHCACGLNPDTRMCNANDCNKRYGLNVGLAVDGEGSPGVCFVYGDVFDPSQESEYTAVGEVHVAWRAGLQADQEWPGEVLGKGEARFFHCAIANPGLFGDQDYPGATVIYDEGKPNDLASVLVSRIQVGGATGGGTRSPASWGAKSARWWTARAGCTSCSADRWIRASRWRAGSRSTTRSTAGAPRAAPGRRRPWRTRGEDHPRPPAVPGARTAGHAGDEVHRRKPGSPGVRWRRLAVDTFTGTETWDAEAVWAWIRSSGRIPWGSMRRCSTQAAWRRKITSTRARARAWSSTPATAHRWSL